MAWLDQIGDDRDALLGAIVDAMPEPFFVLDRDGRYVAVLGGSRSDSYHDGRALVGRRLHEVMPVEIADRFLATIHQALDTREVVNYEYELSSDDVDGVDERPGVPNRLWFDAHIAPLRADAARDDLVVWMIFDITASKLAVERLELQQEELERLARTDALTGLLNRRSFFDEAGRELRWVQRTSEPAAMILLDLDHFKSVNDTWGHAAGDAVLRSVGDVLRTRRRSTDVVARLGGEEFALVVRGADCSAGSQLADRLRREIAALDVAHDGVAIDLTASFGVTEVRPDDQDPEDSIKRADDAMYEAKRTGRNRVVVMPPVA